MVDTTILTQDEVERALKDYNDGADLAACHIPALCQTVRALQAALEESEAHSRVLRERLVVADGVYDARGEYTFHAQTAIHRATSELRDQLTAVTQERDTLREQVRGKLRNA